MSKISRSPDRHSFQKNGYVARMEEKGEEVSLDYLNMFQKILDDEKIKFNDPKSRENNLEYDLLTTDWILEKARGSEAYAQNLYAALCNTSWRSKNLWPTLQEQKWGCSWRYAGGIIADMQQKGDYINWYCSGIRDIDFNQEETAGLTDEQLERLEVTKKYVAEGYVTKEIQEDLDRLGWILIEYEGKEE